MTPEMMAASPTAAVDLPVAGLVVWLGYGKFYSLFSLLFGIGFSLQLAAAERRGDERLRVFKRRLLVLLAIGAVHLYIWEGDILVLYALVGFFLIPFRRLPDRTLLRYGGGARLRPGAARGRSSWRRMARSIPVRRCSEPATLPSSPPASPPGRCPFRCCATRAGRSTFASS